jgi:uncharacterized protein (DUF58 family)
MLQTTGNPRKERSEWLKPEQLASISSLELRARGVVEGFLQGFHRSPFVGYSVEFSSHRRYGAGDDLRHVNWKLFARHRKLYVKEFDAESNMNLYLFVDNSRSMQCKVSGAMTKFDFAATLAASMALLAVNQRDAFALGLLNDGISHFLEPSARPGQWEDCLNVLQTAGDVSVTNLPRALEQAAALARHRGIIFVMSDFVDDADGIGRGLQQLRHRGHEVVLFHILDPYERWLSQSGRVRVRDLENGSIITTDVESLRSLYLKKIEDWCSTLENMCLHQGIDRIEVTTDSSPSQKLVDYLVRRAKQ